MLSCLCDGAYKKTIAANRKKVAHVAAAGFLSHDLSGPYNRKQNVLSASLNKPFPFSLMEKLDNPIFCAFLYE